MELWFNGTHYSKHTCACERFPCNSPTLTPSNPSTRCILWAWTLVWINTIQWSWNVRLTRPKEKEDLKCLSKGTDKSEQTVVDPDQMPHNVASDQGLHYLPLIQQFLDTSTGIKMKLQLNLNSSDTNGSFTMANSYSFLSPYEILLIAPRDFLWNFIVLSWNCMLCVFIRIASLRQF